MLYNIGELNKAADGLQARKKSNLAKLARKWIIYFHMDMVFILCLLYNTVELLGANNL